MRTNIDAVSPVKIAKRISFYTIALRAVIIWQSSLRYASRGSGTSWRSSLHV